MNISHLIHKFSPDHPCNKNCTIESCVYLYKILVYHSFEDQHVVHEFPLKSSKDAQREDLETVLRLDHIKRIKE